MTGRAPTAAATPPALTRTLTLRDVVLFNIVAVMSIRWLATSAAAEPGSLVLWVLAGLLFCVPQGLAVTHLAARVPEQGGQAGGALHWLTGISGLGVTMFAMVIACIPPPDTRHHLLKVLGGALGFLLLGGLLYWRANRVGVDRFRKAA